MKTKLITVALTLFYSALLATPQPNIILIFTDDQGYADIGCFGSEKIKTPHLDRMAVEGMKFTHFYAQPICGPSRAAIMTGCYPMRVAERNNVRNIHPVLHEHEITIAEVLKSVGYATGCFGKWDLAGHSQKNFVRDLMPNHQGFDRFFGTPSSNDSIVDLYSDDQLIEQKASMGILTQRYTDEVISFIQTNARAKKPFFVYLPHSMPHTKLAASDRFNGRSERGLYGDVIEEIDTNVGRIFEMLENLQLKDNTWVIFTSDNGPWLVKNKDYADGDQPGDHGGSAGPLRSGKVSTWEGGVRVPTIAWAPGRIPAGKICDRMATTMDLFPTFAKLAGAKTPTDRVIDGQDISHLLAGRFDEADPERSYNYYFLSQLHAIRQGPWKLQLPRPKRPEWLGNFAKNTHIAPEDDRGFAKHELYNLITDPGETIDVADAHPNIVKKLVKLAEAARKDIGDYNRVGENMRFFDPVEPRPTKLKTAYPQPRAKNK